MLHARSPLLRSINPQFAGRRCTTIVPRPFSEGRFYTTKTPSCHDRGRNRSVRGRVGAEDWLIAAATLVFVEPARSERPRRALYQALGGNRYEHLLGLLTFIRTAHYWTVLHPELFFEEDARELLSVNFEVKKRSPPRLQPRTGERLKIPATRAVVSRSASA